MLQQILRDMCIDKELLAELSDEQKHILFMKMREEQVRRWQCNEERIERELKKKPKKPPKPGKKKVEFLSGKDGLEWVWVMGHHPNDLSIEEILEKEAKEKAAIQAEREAEELRIQQEETLRKKMEEERKKLEKERIERKFQLKREQEEATLYQSLKEVRLIADQLEQKRQNNRQGEEEKLKELEDEKEKRLQDFRENSLKLKNRRSTELYMSWRKMRSILEKNSSEDHKEIEATWKEQEKKSREAENQLREIVRRAREEHRRCQQSQLSGTSLGTSTCSSGSNSSLTESLPPIPPKTHINNINNSSSSLAASDKGSTHKKRAATPKNRSAVIKWFKEEERPKGVGLNPETKKVEEWFHGLISRAEAEKILSDRPIGSFLVRVSERIWGYTVSYQSEERCKHFLIDASDSTYHFFGSNYQAFNTLQEILSYHMKNAITMAGQEMLLFPCGQKSYPPNFAELFYDEVTDPAN
ncbi:SH2 domain-containing protein 4B-like isoform X1 [Argonauta hians]